MAEGKRDKKGDVPPLRASLLDDGWDEPGQKADQASSSQASGPARKDEPAAAPETAGSKPAANLLSRPVVIAGVSTPIWAIASGAVVLIALGIVIIVAVSSSPRATSATPVAPSGSQLPDAASGPITRSLLARAAAGEAEALQALEGRPAGERSAAEVLALADGKSVQRRAELDALARKIAQNAALGADPAAHHALAQYARDRETGREALRVMATLPAPYAADLIYDVWVGTKERNELTQLAEELVMTRDVRGKASPALAVALDLRKASSCEQSAAVLPRAIEHGDRRSQHLLGQLTTRRGCGPDHTQDCTCLKDNAALGEAIKAVAKRQEPKY